MPLPIRPIALFLTLAMILPASAEDPLPIRDLIKKVRPSLATIRVASRDGDTLGIGTGFVIDPSGLIATNFHVISEGRSFTVEMSSGRKLKVVSILASDRAQDLAIIRVDVEEEPLRSLTLADETPAQQGLRVLAFGNPLGLRDSVVEGIVSAVREVEGRQLIQLAMPIEPGNSGGPLVDRDGTVRGIINMKSAVDENLGFAIPIAQLTPLRSAPNPIAIDRWVRLGQINEQDWTPLFGAKWEKRGGMISARGIGDGFGGRSLCLSKLPVPEVPYELAVSVRLDDESGAAGLAFCSDGDDRHYGFYPSGGRLRLSCFKGPNVLNWQVLEEIDSKHYLPGGWNRLRVRVEEDKFQCFVNGHLIVESSDRQLKPGKLGLVKFRTTNPDFKKFRVGLELASPKLSESAQKWVDSLTNDPSRFRSVTGAEIESIGDGGEVAAREITRLAQRLEQNAEQLRKLAADVRLAPTLTRIGELFARPEASEDEQPANEDRLLTGALLIAALDDDDVDIDAYRSRIDEMASEINQRLDAEADDATRLETLDRYLFKENGYHGGRSEYYHPANSHLNRVIDDREGLPITMSILYMEIGRRIGLDIRGVGLPGHFVVKQVDKEGEEQLIDVFDRGNRLSKREAEAMVIGNLGRRMTKEDLRSQTAEEILSRVLRNLMGVAGGNRDGEALRRYAEALVAINPESTEFRLMRAQLRGMTSRNAAAIEDLDWLLEKAPPGFNREAVMQMRDTLIHQD